MTAIIKRTPQVIAFEINSITDQTRKMVLNNSIEIGRKLKEAKEMVNHGKWAEWLKENVNYSQSTATNFMNIFEEFGSNQLVIFGDNSNSQTFANLSYSQAVALLGVPSEEREDFAKENNIEEMTSRELAQAIKDNKELKKRLEEVQEQIETGQSDHDELTFKLAEQEGLVNKLNEELKTAQAAGENSTAKKLKASLDKANEDHAASVKKIKELEKQLKEKPIDIPATTTIEVIPEATKQELETLRKAQEDHAAQLKQKEEEAAQQVAAMQEQLAKNNNTETIKVKVSLAALVDNFKALLAAVEEVKNQDEKAKFKSDIPILCDRLKGMVV
jgi:DNA repair exonuclease SbcCD ATPase subunit